jgi:hypothetical protein
VYCVRVAYPIPSFLLHIHLACSSQLRDIWLKSVKTSEDDGCRVDVLSGLSRAGMDVIGLAGSCSFAPLPASVTTIIGFGYTFDSLTDAENELASAFKVIFETSPTFRARTVLEMWIPLLRRCVSFALVFVR